MRQTKKPAAASGSCMYRFIVFCPNEYKQNENQKKLKNKKQKETKQIMNIREITLTHARAYRIHQKFLVSCVYIIIHGLRVMVGIYIRVRPVSGYCFRTTLHDDDDGGCSGRTEFKLHIYFILISFCTRCA